MKSLLAIILLGVCNPLYAFTLTINSDNFAASPQFSNVTSFDFSIEIDGDLQARAYNNPTITSVTYSVSGSLVQGTPSGFDAFALERDITGEEFYAQGSSLSFEVAESANLSDGLQVDELVGDASVFVFNGREENNGRFHPALLELRSDGTGQIQNSDNVPTLSPRLEVDFGAEYITALTFDAGNLTLVAGTGGGGGGAPSLWLITGLAIMLLKRRR